MRLIYNNAREKTTTNDTCHMIELAVSYFVHMFTFFNHTKFDGKTLAIWSL